MGIGLKSKISESVAELQKQLLLFASRYFGNWITFNLRSVRPADSARLLLPVHSKTKTTLIIQGLVIKENNFTYETARLYRKFYPECAVVLSTWVGLDAKTLEDFRRLGVTVLESEPPADRGPWNINLQIASTKTGVKFARDNLSDYVLKTRSDQRAYGRDIISYFENLCKTFPNSCEYDQKERIIVCGINRMYRLYGASDMLQFGTVDDMLKFWDRPYVSSKDSLSVDSYQKLAPGSVEKAKVPIAEMELTSAYLKVIGRTLNWTFADSLRAFAENFIVVDRSSVDLFWPKYEYYFENKYQRSYVLEQYREIMFRDWLNFYRLNDWESIPSLEAALVLSRQ